MSFTLSIGGHDWTIGVVKSLGASRALMFGRTVLIRDTGTKRGNVRFALEMIASATRPPG